MGRERIIRLPQLHVNESEKEKKKVHVDDSEPPQQALIFRHGNAALVPPQTQALWGQG